MKKFLLVMIFMQSTFVKSQEMSPAETCIAESSGVESVECLKAIYNTLNQELDQLNKATVLSLKYRDKEDIITVNHYTAALRAFNQSILDFKRYRENSCKFSTYYSGGVASGYQQVLYSCLIKQTEIRIEFLELKLKSQ